MALKLKVSESEKRRLEKGEKQHTLGEATDPFRYLFSHRARSDLCGSSPGLGSFALQKGEVVEEMIGGILGEVQNRFCGAPRKGKN
jgi:hypothetical protein